MTADYDGLISYGDVEIEWEVLSEIFKKAEESSVVLKLARKLRNMTTHEMDMKVTNELPDVYFVGEKGRTQTFPADALKKVTNSCWETVEIHAGELAAIIVIPNNVFADANFDVISEVKSQLPTAIGHKIDEAVFYGEPATDVPDDWPEGIFFGMPAENIVDLSGFADIYDAVLGADGVFAQVEADGYEVNGIVAANTLKAQLRGLRADAGTGAPIFQPSMQAAGQYTLAGVPMDFPTNGGFDASQTLMIAGDWNQLVYSLRQDVKFDVFTTGVIQDGEGVIIHNLMQEDLTAIRCTFRMGWAMPIPATNVTISGEAYPFSALV